MSKSFITGFPRIGEQRELKFALESFWSGKSDFASVETVAKELRTRHLNYQKDAKIDYISVGDFSFYDIMLDHIVMFGAIPKRFAGLSGNELYFAMARGNKNARAMEMTKWFNTNYHYIVPELSFDSKFSLNLTKILSEFKEAKELGITPKINLIGPITFLALSKTSDESCPMKLLGALLEQYITLINEISTLDSEIVIQLEEPIFTTDKGAKFIDRITPTYNKLCAAKNNVKIIFMTYFEHATEAIEVALNTHIFGIGIDFVHNSICQKQLLEKIGKSDKVLFAGLIDGRNIWVTNIDEKSEKIATISNFIPRNRINIGTSCSLLHVPYTLKYEENLAIKPWLSFALEKLDEVALLTKITNNETLDEKFSALLNANREAINSRKTSPLINDKAVQERVANLSKFEREAPFDERIKIQKDEFKLPILPTTTIGSFPQTMQIRQIRNAFKKGLITAQTYEEDIKKYIDDCIKFQEEIGLDVLVHGEPERGDMVEYFGEQLKGYAFSKNGWVQSYGSRCVKPPIIFGDVSRPEAMTVAWSTYAQSLTKRPMKGMLTGPVTILQWSFVRNDIPRSTVCKQIALALNDEVLDLEKAGIKVIQIDEPAIREGLPLKRADWDAYLNWAGESFRLSSTGCEDSTQIHTHMCYSEFNDILPAIAAMDADVITIETSRSDMELLTAFGEFKYPNDIGPGVYDIHSPRVPTEAEVEHLLRKAIEVVPVERLWVNPDCGLKTRGWKETLEQLQVMMNVTHKLRAELAK